MRSEQINELMGALSKAQSQMKPARMSGSNPHFRSKYATLNDIIAAVQAPLADNGLAVTQTMEAADGVTCLVTTLAHSSGQYIDSHAVIDAKPGNVQQFGSALTYMRRYQLAALLGVAAEEDDDGNAAQQPQPAQQQNGTEPKMASEAQLKAFHASGVSVYGKDAWEKKRHELVKALTKGRTESANELTAQECSLLIDGIKAKADTN